MTILTFVWRGCAGCWEGEQVLHQQRLAVLAWPGEAAGPGLSGGHSGQASEAREREQLSVQPRQSARAERPSQTECHDQRHRVTRPVTLPSHSAQPLSRMSQWDPPEARWGGGQRSPVRPEDSPPHLWVSSVPCDPPGCQHLTSSSPLALLGPQERERAGVGPWQQCPWFPLGSHHSQSIADSDTGHWPADSSWHSVKPSPAPCQHARRDTSRLKVRHLIPLQQVTKEVRITKEFKLFTATYFHHSLSPWLRLVAWSSE